MSLSAPKKEGVLMSKTLVLLLICFSMSTGSASAQEVVWQHEDAVVWGQEQVVEGAVEGSAAVEGVLYAGDDTLAFAVEGGAFAVPVRLREGVTPLVACVDEGLADGQLCSDTLRYEVGFVPRPEAELVAIVEGRHVTLRGRVIANPDSTQLAFTWAQDPDNAAPVTLDAASDSVATFTLPSAVSGVILVSTIDSMSTGRSTTPSHAWQEVLRRTHC